MAESNVKRGYVYFGRGLEASGLVGRLKDWFNGDEPAYLAAFRPDDRRLWYFDPAEAAKSVAEWPEGQVFSSGCEVRWRKQGDGYSLWLLTEESDWPANLEGLQAVNPVGGHWQAVDRTHLAQSVYLWGQYKPQEEAWVEVRVPWSLIYPVEKERPQEDAFARIGHLDYHAPNGAVQFVRLTAVQLMEVDNE